MNRILTKQLYLAVVSLFFHVQVFAQTELKKNETEKTVYVPLKSGNEVRLDVEYKKVAL